MEKWVIKIARVVVGIGMVVVAGCSHKMQPVASPSMPLYALNHSLESRSISFENPTGDRGAGGKAASNLGVGRKGAPCRTIAPNETVTLCDVNGPGTIRHIWMTSGQAQSALLGMVIRAYWEGQPYPSIEAPLGNFFGVSHGVIKKQAYQSAVHAVNPSAGMSIYLPMPFQQKARITLTNESSEPQILYYSIDYTVGDNHEEPMGRLHILYRRENPTQLKQDFEILPHRTGTGRYLGCVLGIRTLKPEWWGEGEVKVYLDGDKEFPTLVGTGTEDYIGQSWGLQDVTYLYGGTNLYSGEAVPTQKDALISIYRWHILDPVYWKKEVRITIQQIGCCPYFDRQDDWTATTFWYEPIPSESLPPLPGYEQRIKDLPK